MACVNTTAVLYEGDPGAAGRAIAERLARSSRCPATTSGGSAYPDPRQRTALANHLAGLGRGHALPLLGADQVVAALGDGYAALRPAVHLLAEPDVDKLNIELPFPCVWVAPWSRADGLEPLRHSLVISAITDDDDLIDDLLAEPTIANVYGGQSPDLPRSAGDPARRIPGRLPDAQQRLHPRLRLSSLGFRCYVELT